MRGGEGNGESLLPLVRSWIEESHKSMMPLARDVSQRYALLCLHRLYAFRIQSRGPGLRVIGPTRAAHSALRPARSSAKSSSRLSRAPSAKPASIARRKAVSASSAAPSFACAAAALYRAACLSPSLRSRALPLTRRTPLPGSCSAAVKESNAAAYLPLLNSSSPAAMLSAAVEGAAELETKAVGGGVVCWPNR